MAEWAPRTMWSGPEESYGRAEYIAIKEAVAEDDENDRLVHAFTPGLNVKLALSCSTVRRSQRNVPEDRRGTPRPAIQNYMERHAPFLYHLPMTRATGSPGYWSTKANVPSHQLMRLNRREEI